MKQVMILLLVCLFPMLGCATDDPAPRTDEPAAVESSEEVEEVEQEVGLPCFQHCQCPLSERCSASYYCESYATWGGDTNPLRCMNDCQCINWYSPGYKCNMDSGTYGHCVPSWY